MNISDTSSAAAVDRRERPTRLRLAPGIHLVQRDDSTVQVGVDGTRTVLIADAPAGTLELLTALDGGRTVSEALAGLRRRHRAAAVEDLVPVLDELVDRGLLVPQPHRPDGAGPPTVAPERIALAAVTDVHAAADAMRRRTDAVVAIRGSGRIAASIATVLAAAGVGHVHLQPDRALRAADAAPAGLGGSELTAMQASAPAATVRPGRRTAADRTEHRRIDQDTLSAMLRRVSPQVKVHPPTGRLPPAVVVLAGDGPARDDVARPLVTDRIPHLEVRAGHSGAAVGPFVMPGRSSCLHCHDLHRTDADPDWPRVRLALSRLAPAPAAVLATQAAAIAAGEVLRYLDGLLPWTVDGTLDVPVADWHIRRRSWHPHPRCFCRAAAG